MAFKLRKGKYIHVLNVKNGGIFRAKIKSVHEGYVKAETFDRQGNETVTILWEVKNETIIELMPKVKGNGGQGKHN